MLCERADLQTLIQLPYKDRHVDLEEEVWCPVGHISSSFLFHTFIQCMHISEKYSLFLLFACKVRCVFGFAAFVVVTGIVN